MYLMLRACLVTLVLVQFLAVTGAAAQPAVFWFNDPVGPDDTVLVTGANLNSVTAVTIRRLADETPVIEADAGRAVDILQPNPQSLKFIVPKDFAPGIYRFTLSYAKGAISAEINR